MRDSYHSNNQHSILAWPVGFLELDAPKCCDENIHRYKRAMTEVFIWFHRLIFVVALIVAFFLGALNAARADALEEKQVKYLMGMNIEQLTEIYIM